MERRLYVIYDAEAGIYGPPMEGRNDVIATRHFRDGMAQSPLPKEMKEQMILIHWGNMDDETGKFEYFGEALPVIALAPPEDLTDVM